MTFSEENQVAYLDIDIELDKQYKFMFQQYNNKSGYFVGVNKEINNNTKLSDQKSTFALCTANGMLWDSGEASSKYGEKMNEGG